MLFLLIMLIAFYCNIMFRITLWVIFWNVGRISFHVFSIEKIKSIKNIHFFLAIFSWLVIYSFTVISIYESLYFWYSSRFFPVLSWFNATVAVYWKDLWYDLWLLFWFSSNQAYLYMVHLVSDFFYDICNTINKHNQR